MGFIAKPNTAVRLPTIRLDTTLADLYKCADPDVASQRIGFVFSGVNSALDLTGSFPRNAKFLYQDSPFNTLATEKLVQSASGSLRRSLATRYLSLIAQRDAFITGPASVAVVICFSVDPADPDRSRREAEATISVLDPHQRPELVFYPGPSDIPPLRELKVGSIACKVVLDGLEGFPLTVPLETTWYLNPKAALADSGLPTRRMAAWLAEKGYYGPAGMDILETAAPGRTDSHTGEDTAYHIVDLNVRTSGSMCLPVLRGHFTNLGLGCASSFSITVKGNRQAFIEAFREDFLPGQMCILGWYHDVDTDESNADLVVGGSDEADLQQRMKKVRDVTKEVVF